MSCRSPPGQVWARLLQVMKDLAFVDLREQTPKMLQHLVNSGDLEGCIVVPLTAVVGVKMAAWPAARSRKGVGGSGRQGTRVVDLAHCIHAHLQPGAENSELMWI